MKSRLRRLAKEFNLRFSETWFKLIWISKRENILLEYMWMCPDPIYNKYGKTPYERAKNIECFIDSEEFKECLGRFGGQVIERNTFKKYFPGWINEIENLEVMGELYSIYKKILGAIGMGSRIAVLTKSSKKSEIEKVKSFVLFHEFIHILVNENKLDFKDWRYNEGLVTYFQEFSDSNLGKLEENVKRTKYDFQKQYYIYAIKFRDLFNKMNNAERRKQAIIKMKNSLVK